jgi:hypothetical protein
MSIIKIEINNNLELIETLLLMSDTKHYNKELFINGNKKYISDILEYFYDFRNHSAVQKTKYLIENKYFTNIKPVRAALLLDNILSDNNKSEINWAEKVHMPADANELLVDWIHDVEKYKKDTHCENFFAVNSDYYNMITNKIESFNINSWVSFIEEYFRDRVTNFNLIISPIDGNYGFNLDIPQKNTPHVVRCMPDYDADGNIKWCEDYFAKGIAHEFAHCFVNPVVEGHKNKLTELMNFFQKHTNMIDCYNVDYAIMNEYWVRAFTDIFMMKLSDSFPNFDIKQDLARQRLNFIYLNDFITLLKQYEKQDISFCDFYLSSIDYIKEFYIL